MRFPEEVVRFLNSHRVALVGASSKPGHFSRAVLEAFEQAGYDVVPVNPRGGAIGGRQAAASLLDVKPRPEAALVMVPAEKAAGVVADAVLAGIPKVWLHRGAGQGSVSDAAVRLAESARLDLVKGECPLMFLPQAGLIHRVHRFLRARTWSKRAPTSAG